MQRALAAVAEARQEAEAKLIQAKAQRESASILAEASQAMGQDPAALQLQWRPGDPKRVGERPMEKYGNQWNFHGFLLFFGGFRMIFNGFLWFLELFRMALRGSRPCGSSPRRARTPR